MKYRLAVTTICAFFTLVGCDNGDTQSSYNEKIKEIERKARAWEACGGTSDQSACMARYGYKWNGFGWEPSHSDPRLDVHIPDQTNVSVLSGSDDLGDWRRASSSDRLKLSTQMINVLNKKGSISSEDERILGYSVYNCINETAGDGGVDAMKISETAAACITIISNQ